MDKFNIANYGEYSELPFDLFNQFNFSIYVIDRNWNYLFVNDFVGKNLGEKGADLIGKNMWEQFPELALDPSFSLLQKKYRKRIKHRTYYYITNYHEASSYRGKTFKRLLFLFRFYFTQ